MSEVCKVAPAGQFRVIGKDSPNDNGWQKGDYATIGEAREASVERSFVQFQVFDDQGQRIYE